MKRLFILYILIVCLIWNKKTHDNSPIKCKILLKFWNQLVILHYQIDVRDGNQSYSVKCFRCLLVVKLVVLVPKHMALIVCQLEFNWLNKSFSPSHTQINIWNVRNVGYFEQKCIFFVKIMIISKIVILWKRICLIIHFHICFNWNQPLTHD